MLSQHYYTLGFPYLNYGAMSCGNTYPTKLMKLKTKQNKCLRSIFLLIAENLLSHITKYLKGLSSPFCECGTFQRSGPGLWNVN